MTSTTNNPSETQATHSGTTENFAQETAQENTQETATYRPKTLPFILLGGAILVASVFLVKSWTDAIEPEEPQEPEEEIPFVRLQPVTTSANQATFTTGGFVHAQSTANLAAKANGTVNRVAPIFAVGNRVNKGDVLAVIDKKDYVAALESAKSALATAKSSYAQEQAQSRQVARDTKRLGVKATSVALRHPQLAAAKAAIKNAEAQLKLAQQNLSNTTLKAPFDAIIQSKNIAVGDNVGENTVVGQLVGIQTFTVNLTLDSTQFSLVGIGDNVKLTNAATGAVYAANINRFDPTINPNTRTVGAYVDIDNPLSDGKPLLLNSYLTAEITGKTLPDTMWIANSDNMENQYVWTADAENNLATVPFTLFYRGTERSLVRFDAPISRYITNPKDSFFAGEEVTDEMPSEEAENEDENEDENTEEANNG